MAAAVIADMIGKKGLSTSWTVASAGLHCGSGAKASKEAVAASAELGLDLSAHRSRPMTDNLASSAKYILAMTSSLARELAVRFPFARGKIFTLGSFAGKNKEITDPFGGSLKVYRACLDDITVCSEGFVGNLTGNRE